MLSIFIFLIFAEQYPSSSLYFLLYFRANTGFDNVSEMECVSCHGKILRKYPGLQCAGDCGAFYHAKCVGLTLENLRVYKAEGASWRCRSCSIRSDRSIIIADDLPPSSPSLLPSNSRCLQPLGASSLQNPSQTASQLPKGRSFEGMFDILKDIQAEMKGLSNKYEEVLRAVTFYGEKISDFESKMTDLDKKLRELDSVKAENIALRSSLGEVMARVEQLEQYSRRNNVIISGVPESASESLTDVVGLIGDAVGSPVSSGDIDAVHRLPARGNSNLDSSQSKDRKPKNIVVRFLSRMIRDRFLGAAKMKQRVGSGGVGASGALRGITVTSLGGGIYVNEHLTAENAKLLREVKLVAAEKQYKFVWFKGDVIRVRKSERSHVVIIRSPRDLQKL